MKRPIIRSLKNALLLLPLFLSHPLISASVQKSLSEETTQDYINALRKEPLYTYHHEFKEYYPHVLREKPTLSQYHKLPDIITTDGGDIKAYSYEKKEVDSNGFKSFTSAVQIVGSHQPSVWITLSRYRNFEIQFLSSDLVFIQMDIGHIAGTESILKLSGGGKFIYQMSYSFNKFSSSLSEEPTNIK